jgi:hypothetical protein
MHDADSWSSGITSQEISRRTPLMDVAGMATELGLGSQAGTFRGDQSTFGR